MVAAAVGFGDEGAGFALAAFEVAVLEGVEGVFYLLGEGELGGAGGVVGFDGVLKGAGEEDAALLVGCGVEGIGWDGGVGESFEERGGGEVLYPLGVVDDLGGGDGAGRDRPREGRGRGGGRVRSRWRGRTGGSGRFRCGWRRLV